jgi:hypothetical protein
MPTVRHLRDCDGPGGKRRNKGETDRDAAEGKSDHWGHTFRLDLLNDRARGPVDGSDETWGMGFRRRDTARRTRDAVVRSVKRPAPEQRSLDMGQSVKGGAGGLALVVRPMGIGWRDDIRHRGDVQCLMVVMHGMVAVVGERMVRLAGHRVDHRR